MYIITLIKANLRYRKANFISILVLMLIISVMITAVMGIRKGSSSHVDEAFQNANVGDLMLWYEPGVLTDEMIQKVTDLDEIEKVDVVDAVYTKEEDNVTVAGTKAGQVFDFQVYDKTNHPYNVYNDSFTNFEKSPKTLETGKIYVPVCFRTKYNCNTGDVIKIQTDSFSKEYTIQGFLEEPTMGNPLINGYKNVFLSKADFDELYALAKKENSDFSITEITQVYCTEGANLTDNKLNILLNDTANMVSYANTTVSKVQFKSYSTVIINIFISVLCLFAIILYLVVLVIIRYHISTSIEMDYVDIGILKSQGFLGSNLRKVYIYQYLVSQIIVGAIGCALGGIVAKILASILVQITGLLLVDTSAIGMSALIILGMCAISVLVVYLKTVKIVKVSPMAAILERQDIVKRPNKIKMEIQKKGLLMRMAIRQMTSNIKQYISSAIIVALLVCFMMMISTILTCFDESNILNEFYGFSFDLEIDYGNNMDLKKDVEKFIEDRTEITKKSMFYTGSFIVDNTSVLCNVVDSADRFVNIYKGNKPSNADEIVITEVFGKAYNVSLGDTLNVSLNGKGKEFKIVGYYQSVNKAGMQFSMLQDGALSLDPAFKMTMCDYTIAKPNDVQQISDELIKKFDNKIKVTTSADVLDTVKTISDLSAIIVLIVYAISIFFVLVVAYMVCNKVFLREKKDCGIYKAFGFGSFDLRVLFALRFLLVSLIGAVIGAAFSVLVNKAILGMVLKVMGITNFNAKYTVLGVAGPIILLCGSLTLGAYYVSRKIKKVDIRILIVE